MCFGFIWYYPAEANLDSCVSYQEYDECEYPNDMSINQPISQLTNLSINQSKEEAIK